MCFRVKSPQTEDTGSLINVLRTVSDTLMVLLISEHKSDNTLSRKREKERKRISDKMPVRVVQSEVSPPLPFNSKQVRKYLRCDIYHDASLSARGVPHSPLQWLQVHGTSEVKRESVRRRGYVTGDSFSIKIRFSLVNKVCLD